MFTEEVVYLLTNLPPLPLFGEQLTISIGEIIRIIRTFDNKKLEQVLYPVFLYPALNFLLAKKLEIFSDSKFKDQNKHDAGSVDISNIISENISIDNELISFINKFELPESLEKIVKSENNENEDEIISRFWLEYFLYTADYAKLNNVNIMHNWAKFEITLRFLLQALRNNKILDKETAARIRCEELFSKLLQDRNYIDGKVAQIMDEMIQEYDFSKILLEACNSHDPLSLERLLDRARINFLDSHSISYSFTLDELVNYLIKMSIYERYNKLSDEIGFKILKEVAKYEP